MIIIAHRALLDNTDHKWSNHPDQIIKSIEAGFCAEIDIRYASGKWWLGHDEAQYEVPDSYIKQHSHSLIIHAKDIPTLHQLHLLDSSMQYRGSLFAMNAKPSIKHWSGEKSKCLHYFFHDQDDCALTSQGYIWQYPKNIKLTPRSIACMPERVSDWDGIDECYGICTDLPHKYKYLYE